MEAIEFWEANRGRLFEAGYTTWSMRFVGTGSDYERFRAQIDGAFAAHAARRNQHIVAITTVKEDGGFTVYGVAAANG